MIYKRYGEIFRKLRKQRNLSLAHFEALGISKSSLGKFERGEAMMAFDRVMLALQELDVTLAEFEHFLNNFSQSDTESFADDIFEAYIKNDKEQLLYLSKQLMEEGYPILSLTAKVAIEQTDFKNSSRLGDVETFKNFLYNAKLWGYIELCIFYHTVSYFKTSEILYLLDTCFSSNSYLFNVPKYRIKFLHVGYSSVIILSRRGAKESSLYLLKKLEAFNFPQTMSNRNLQNFANGYWNYCFGDSLKGKEMISESLSIIQHLDTPEMYAYFSKVARVLLN